MSDDQMRPPPMPARPGDTTEPGLGLLALKTENARLRKERNEARNALLFQSDSGSLPPPTAKQRRGKAALAFGKYGALALLLPAVGAAVTKRWPEYGDLIVTILQALVGG